MCYNCGCLIPDDNMGSDDNITNSTFEQLAKHWKISPTEAKAKVFAMLENNKIDDEFVKKTFEKATAAWGQSMDEAIKNVHDLLKKEIANKKN